MDDNRNIEKADKEPIGDLTNLLTNKIKNSFLHIFENTNLIIHDDDINSNDLRDLISKVNKIAKENYDMIDNIPNIFRREKSEIVENSVNVNNIIYEILRFYKSNISKKSLSIRLNLCEEAFLSVAENKLNFIFRNILLNAFNYTDKNDFVEISTKIMDDSFYFVVTDNGKGMNRERILQIFESEECSNSSLRKCQELIKDLNGDLVIGSEVNMGTKVTVSIPYDKTL